MASARDERRLAAIMFTDIVGYTALTERDEARAIEARERHRRLVQTLVEQFEGEVVEAPGDETLALFPAALAAVDCALALQAALRDDEDVAVRIGIHLGDVLRHDGELIGEGVNIAARLRPLAEPGGICVSGAVWRLVRSRRHVQGHSLGEQALKNVSEDYEVFALETAPESAPMFLQRRAFKYAAALAVTLALGYALYLPNRALVLSSAAIYGPVLFADPIEQELGFATASDGVRIAYATTGEGPPVVFVLGWATHLERGLGSPLYDGAGIIRSVSRRHLYVRYDGRGFGLSDRDVDDFSLDARVGDLEAVVDAAGLERFAVHAVSAGGPTAVAYAARHPERVSRMVFQATHARVPQATDPEAMEQWRGMLPLFRSSWDSPIVRSMMTTFLAPNANEVGSRVLSEFLRLSGDGPAVAGFIEALVEIDTRDLARRIEAPTLVVHGDADTAVPLEGGRQLASLIPGARFEIVEGLTHIGPPDRARQARELVAAFLAEDLAGDEGS